MTIERDAIWLTFWYTPWRNMDASWLAELTEHHDLIATSQCLDAMTPQGLRAKFALNSSHAPSPDNTLISWLQVDEHQRQRACYLASEIALRGSANERLSPSDTEWCRHIAKALRPNVWLPAEMMSNHQDILGLWLLKQWVADDIWQRLRLWLPYSQIGKLNQLADATLPELRIQPLWHSIVWRINSSPQA